MTYPELLTSGKRKREKERQRSGQTGLRLVGLSVCALVWVKLTHTSCSFVMYYEQRNRELSQSCCETLKKNFYTHAADNNRTQDPFMQRSRNTAMKTIRHYVGVALLHRASLRPVLFLIREHAGLRNQRRHVYHNRISLVWLTNLKYAPGSDIDFSTIMGSVGMLLLAVHIDTTLPIRDMNNVSTQRLILHSTDSSTKTQKSENLFAIYIYFLLIYSVPVQKVVTPFCFQANQFKMIAAHKHSGGEGRGYRSWSHFSSQITPCMPCRQTMTVCGREKANRAAAGSPSVRSCP